MSKGPRANEIFGELAQSGVQISQERAHLLVVKASGKRRHHSLPGEDDPLHCIVGCGCSTGQRRSRKDAVQIGRNFFQGEIVVLVAMRAPHRVEMLPCRLLGGERRCLVTAGSGEDCARKDSKRNKKGSMRVPCGHAFTVRPQAALDRGIG